MANRKSKTASSGLTAATIAAFALGSCALAGTQEQLSYATAAKTAPRAQTAQRTIDLAKVGYMKDVLSNALLRGLNVPEGDVKSFLAGAEKRYANGPELLKATAKQFKLEEAVLTAETAKFKHVNCTHAGGSESAAPRAESQQVNGLPVSKFARDVTLAVVLHEIGHGLIREFDIPVIANEETTADAFATYYLTTYMPSRAVDALTARVTSLMIEAGESKEIDWSGEHDHDARRAHQIAALAIAADPVKYKAVAAVVKMSEDDITKARDYGAEILRSWRRVLTPLLMPNGTASREGRVLYDAKSEFLSQLAGPLGGEGLASEIETVLKRFDWHSQVTVSLVEGDGKAGWSRSTRTVTVHSKYVRRFIEQGRRGLSGLSW